MHQLVESGDAPRLDSLAVSAKEKKSIYETKKWNQFIDGLGCTRIIRTQVTGWEYEDDKTPRSTHPKSKTQWKSLNAPGYVHIGNPVWHGGYDKNNHIIRIPKDIADTVLLLGLP